MAGQDLVTLAQRLAERDRARRRWRAAVGWSGLAAGLALLLATARGAWWASSDWTAAFLALGLAWAGGLAWLWWRARADARRLLGAADRQVEAEEQLITTYELELEAPGNPFLPLLRRRCEALVQRVDPRALIPMRLSKPGRWALAFALAAGALFLLPPKWLRMTQAALTPTQSLVAEEGARIRHFAERLEEVANRQELPLAKSLAKEAQVVGKAMEEKELSALDASKQLEGLIQLAEELADQAERESKDGFTGEQQVNFESQAQGKQGAEESGAPAGYTGGGNNQVQQETGGSMPGEQNPNESNMSSIDDPFAESQPEKPPESRQERSRNLQREVLERAQMQLEQSQRSVAEGNNAVAEQAGVAEQRSKNSMEDMSSASPDEMGSMGQEDARPANSMNEGENQKSTPADAFGQGPTNAENERKGPDGKPEQTGFQDSQVFGMSDRAEADEKWVRQLPTLNAREIRPDGSLQDFQQASVRAQGGSAIPRAQRAVVRAYFMNLERLNIDLDAGDTAEPEPEPQAAEPAAEQDDPGGTSGPEYQGALEVPPIIDGARGPQR